MSAGLSSTAHYEAVLNDLKADQAKLRAEADEAIAVAKAKEQAALDLDRVIETLSLRLPKSVELHVTTEAKPVADFLVGLQLGDACIAMLRHLGRPASNREIAEALDANGYKVNSENPINNVGSCLNHRSTTKADVEREGKSWALRKGEGPAHDGASHMNGAAVPAA